MTKFNCEKFLNKCEACCCTLLAFDPEYWETYKHKAIREVVEIRLYQLKEKKLIIPVTQSKRCPFLNEENKCHIYNERPFICKQYGSEVPLTLSCLYQNKNGKKRTVKEKEALEFALEEVAERINKNLEKAECTIEKEEG